jgi:hypothetical protein
MLTVGREPVAVPNGMGVKGISRWFIFTRLLDGALKIIGRF